MYFISIICFCCLQNNILVCSFIVVKCKHLSKLDQFTHNACYFWAPEDFCSWYKNSSYLYHILFTSQFFYNVINEIGARADCLWKRPSHINPNFKSVFGWVSTTLVCLQAGKEWQRFPFGTRRLYPKLTFTASLLLESREIFIQTNRPRDSFLSTALRNFKHLLRLKRAELSIYNKLLGYVGGGTSAICCVRFIHRRQLDQRNKF